MRATTAATDVRILDQRTPEERDRPFLPGMGRTWLLPLYDVVTRVLGARALHVRAVELAGIAPGHVVVDAGCGTGNLSFAVLAAEPDARVTGLDPDHDALRRAARKARRRNLSLTLVQGYADRIPAEDGGHSTHGHGSTHVLRHLPRPMRSRKAHGPAVAGNPDNDIPALLAGAGFDAAREVDHVDHRFGRITFVQATRPA
ncbi:class I SAM-dependent methyltransferase [Actinobacteria bacterium YIM 96077]|uniref:SAM-dependent methyltransferase n=1 Tax=Phytoactinopolyspora halophila TaxID=1981511 RepID=A0A329QR02_9ACTN|nr:class I SAM-dependent methyltransferase [Phytoactinopolyspora halophila]AYY14854.1 class I SAM-dependent methyltransferase [Actinobacteria bacterium YIM 96077]RAW13128.1 SAM-dependent methyltransferase [Phytoactinopolyspora halophila]